VDVAEAEAVVVPDVVAEGEAVDVGWEVEGEGAADNNNTTKKRDVTKEEEERDGEIIMH
jgi:hypothetical protein